MHRPKILVASRHENVAAALCQCLALGLPSDHFPHDVESIRFSCGADLFDQLDCRPAEGLRETLLVIDLPAKDRAGAWQVGDLYTSGLATRLVLSYPEIYCAFLGNGASLWQALPEALPEVADEERRLVEQHHFVAPWELITLFDLIRLHTAGFRTLLDPTGLRSILKAALFETVGGPRARVYAPMADSRRRHAAAVADEELPFVYLNGYAAYKAGFRAWFVSTKAEYQGLLRPKTPAAIVHRVVREGPAVFQVLLADWDLVYPDHVGELWQGSLLLYEPPERYNRLVLITGFRHTEQDLLVQKRQASRSYKPYGGFHDLLERQDALRENYYAVTNAIDVISRANGGHRADSIRRQDGHTAPFSRGVVAASLLARARALTATEKANTESWIHAALLACEAKEILGGLSRTTSYEAIALQNEAEVVAEISFFGTLAQSKVGERLEVLHQETALVERVSSGDDPEAHPESNRAQLNCLLQTVNTLRNRLSDFQQIEAAEECLRKVTEYHDRLDRWDGWARARRIASRVRRKCANVRRAAAQRVPRVGWLFSWYPGFATRAGTSLWRLAWVSAVWILLFGASYYLLLAGQTTAVKSAQPCLWLWHSCLTFALQPSISPVEQFPDAYLALRDDWRYRAAVLGELIVAYVHLGLLLSVLYRVITKRAP